MLLQQGAGRSEMGGYSKKAGTCGDSRQIFGDKECVGGKEMEPANIDSMG